METTGQIIAQQLGHKAIFMMGAKNLLADDKGLQFKIGRNVKKVTHITITLEPSDTYAVKFQKVGTRATRYAVTVLAELRGVHVGELHDAIERNTGLYLSL